MEETRNNMCKKKSFHCHVPRLWKSFTNLHGLEYISNCFVDLTSNKYCLPFLSLLNTNDALGCYAFVNKLPLCQVQLGGVKLISQVEGTLGNLLIINVTSTFQI